MVKLYIDDLRDPPTDDFVVVRSSDQAIAYIEQNGIPSFISFDHDLGGDDTAMVVVNYIIEAVLDQVVDFPDDFSFLVHSANPIGAVNIECKLSNFISAIHK